MKFLWGAVIVVLSFIAIVISVLLVLGFFAALIELWQVGPT